MMNIHKKCKVAILQNQIGIDGRSRVIIYIIKLLNEIGIIPDFLTFSNPSNVNKFRQEHGVHVDYQLCRIPLPYTAGCLHQMIMLNILSNSKLKRYDCVINSNDTFFFLPRSSYYIHYIHDPLEAAFAEARQGLGRPGWNYYVRALAVICALSRPCLSNGIFLANSQFTRRRLQEYYPRLQDRIEVIYPPTVAGFSICGGPVQRNIDVVSLGTFSPHKNQLQQLQVAKALPHLQFVLIGSVWSRSYFQACEDFIKSQRLQNATLVPDASQEQLENILGSAKIFLHTKRDEGFGISTVQAMAAGCVPLVHDSGGSREVVPWPALRFQADQQIPGKIDGLMANGTYIMEHYRQAVQTHVQQFTVGHFQEKMGRVLTKVFGG
jgi:glycosyltransferase involved in cell wall biosynthesis